LLKVEIQNPYKYPKDANSIQLLCIPPSLHASREIYYYPINSKICH
jgi:hypothetical protein